MHGHACREVLRRHEAAVRAHQVLLLLLHLVLVVAVELVVGHLELRRRGGDTLGKPVVHVRRKRLLLGLLLLRLLLGLLVGEGAA